MATVITDRKTAKGTLPSETSSGASETVQHADERRKWYMLAVLSIGSFMLMLDETIVNVAIPAIMRDLGTDIASIEWVLNGYLLGLAVLLITLGRMADLHGRRRVLVGGTILFTMASVVSGLAPSLQVLIGARVLQGVGAAAMMPTAVSIVTVAFPKKQRGTALGLLGAAGGIAIALGPILGGLITESTSWRWIFLINIPMGIFAIAGALRYVHESADRETRRATDYVGVLTISASMLALTFALVEGQKYGWTSPLIAGLLALSVIGLVMFAIVERGQPNALMDLGLFRNRTFLAANAAGLVLMFGGIGVLFLVTLFMQVTLGASAVQTGLAMTPMAAAMILAAPFAGRLSDRVGSRWLIFAGLTIGAGGLYWLGRLTLGTAWTDLMAPMAVVGLGMGIVMPPMTAAVMASAPLAKAGNASGTLNTMRQIGSVLGIAALGAVLQNQLVTNMIGALSQISLPAEIKSGIIQAVNSGVHIESVASAAGGAGPLAAQMRQLFNEQFVASLNQTLTIGAVVVLAGALLALLMENHASDL